jgi:protein-L-isoaspartate O-methyltransferase
VGTGKPDLREAREREFWDHAVPDLGEALKEYESGPDPNTALMFDVLEPLHGKSVLDFACGLGLTSAWLADRGATVVGIDLSPKTVERASELAKLVNANVTFVAGELGSVALEPAVFDRLVGRYALHHVDCATLAPLLADHLGLGGVAAFLETMDSNPVLRLARRHLVGRFGIPRYGTFDEHPLTEGDLTVLRNAFGELELRVAEMQFLRILDRQVLQHRRPRASRLLGAVDDFLLGRLRWRSASYQQVVVLRKSRRR